VASLTIIDHSLTDIGSHHAGFATSVGQAALAGGKRILIGANRKFHGELLDRELPVRAVFRNTVYGNGSLLAGLDRNDRWRFDTPGDLRWKSGLLHWSRKITRHGPTRLWNNSVTRFAEDCHQLFRSCEFSPDDHVLVATASEVEVSGLCRFLAQNPQTILGTWHLLFHFSVMRGRPPEYPAQLERLRTVRDRFFDAIRMVPYHQLRFHTTTHALADQYNRMGIAPFRQLDWPIDEGFRPQGNPVHNFSGKLPGLTTGPMETVSFHRDRPLRVVMPGTVRREKGQSQYLSNLLNELGPDYLDTGKLQFILQAPRRPWYQRRKITLGDRPVSWDDNPASPIVVHPHPLPPDRYRNLVDSADIGLLMYDQTAYYARRAGVMCELLSCGKPVIVSAGTWLADELEEYRSDRALSIANGPLAIRRLERSDISFPTRNLPHPGGVLSFDQERHAAEFSFEVSPDEGGVVIQFQWHHPTSTGTYCRVEKLLDKSSRTVSVVAGHRPGCQAVAIFFRLKTGNPVCQIRITNAFHDACASIQNLSITTLDRRAADLPIGQVGLSIYDHSELPAAIREMELYYDHYHRTASAWSGEWFSRQNARRTLQSLLPPESGSFRRVA